MKSKNLILHISITLLALFVLAPNTFADCNEFFSFGDCTTRPPICNDGECTLNNGVNVAGDAVGSLITNKKLSTYAQDVVAYLLGFISLIALIYILYAGLQIILGAGDEEKIKKAKNIVIYVIIGIIVMWLAYSIVLWILGLLDANTAKSIISAIIITEQPFT